MKKSNTAKKVVPEINELEIYKNIVDQIKVLETQKDAIRRGLFAAMDAEGGNELVRGSFKAVRAVTFQERLDTVKVKEFLGVRVGEFTTKVEAVRLTVL